MSNHRTTPPPPRVPNSSPVTTYRPGTAPASILSQSRRQLSGTNSIFGPGRNVSFPVNPVTMSQSPPQHSTPSNPSSNEATPSPLSRGRSGSRSASLPPLVRSGTSSGSSGDTTPGSRSRSVKHLTCFWWKEKGSCKYTEDECLYAHHDTGRYTDAPRQLNPDEPAKAGRNLARALGDLNLRGHRSSSSLLSTPTSSRPGTPVGAYGARPTTPSMLSRAQSPSSYENIQEAQDVQSQITLYRNVIATTTQEKQLMLEVILDLKSTVSELKAAVGQLESDKNILARENQALKSAVAFQQPTANRYGAIGSGAVPGLGHGLGNTNTFTSQLTASVPAWAPRSAPLPTADRRPGTPNTNPSDDGDYEDMRAVRRASGY